MAMLAAFRAAAGTQGFIHRTESQLPDNLTGEIPFTYIGDVNETEEHSNQVRTLTFKGELGYVDSIENRDQSNDRTNFFADYMRDLFTLNYNVLPPGILSQDDYQDPPAEISQGNVTMAHAMIRWTFTVQEGYR
jgi:hypothetical protein